MTSKNIKEIKKEIEKINWSRYETAYGNAAEDIPEYVGGGYIPKIATCLLNLFSENKKTEITATNDIWCSLCHQYAFVSSAALPAYDFLFYALQNSDDDIKIELLDIFRGFAFCIPKNTSSISWQGKLRLKLEKDKTYFFELSMSKNEEVAYLAEDIVNEL